MPTAMGVLEDRSSLEEDLGADWSIVQLGVPGRPSITSTTTATLSSHNRALS